MSDLPVRDRVTAILTLADEIRGKRCWLCHELRRDCECRQMWLFGGRPEGHGAQLPDEAEWLVSVALEALDTIDRLEGKLAWHEDQMAQVPEEAWNLHGSSDPDA